MKELDRSIGDGKKQLIFVRERTRQRSLKERQEGWRDNAKKEDELYVTEKKCCRDERDGN